MDRVEGSSLSNYDGALVSNCGGLEPQKSLTSQLQPSLDMKVMLLKLEMGNLGNRQESVAVSVHVMPAPGLC